MFDMLGGAVNLTTDIYLSFVKDILMMLNIPFLVRNLNVNIEYDFHSGH